MELRCGECGCALRSWERVWLWETGSGGEYVCEDCFDSLRFGLSREEAARRMGCRELPAGALKRELEGQLEVQLEREPGE